MVETLLKSETIRNHFMGWQCRLRQHAIRHLNGMPSKGLKPDIVLDDSESAYDGVTLVLVRKRPEVTIKEFRHIVMRTPDPRQRYDSALKYMSETYYQHPDAFSDVMTALFGPGSSAAERIISVGRVMLLFNEKNQTYQIPCLVKSADSGSDAWKATFWHNHLFNPNLPADCAVLQFVPDWENAIAEPDVY